MKFTILAIPFMRSHGEEIGMAGRDPARFQATRSVRLPSDRKEIVNRTTDGKKALGVSKGFKVAHVAFSLAGGLMRDFSPVAYRFRLDFFELTPRQLRNRNFLRKSARCPFLLISTCFKG